MLRATAPSPRGPRGSRGPWVRGTSCGDNVALLLPPLRCAALSSLGHAVRRGSLSPRLEALIKPPAFPCAEGGGESAKRALYWRDPLGWPLIWKPSSLPSFAGYTQKLGPRVRARPSCPFEVPVDFDPARSVGPVRSLGGSWRRGFLRSPRRRRSQKSCPSPPPPPRRPRRRPLLRSRPGSGEPPPSPSDRAFEVSSMLMCCRSFLCGKPQR